MEKIFVTQPTLPKFEDFIEYLQKIWESKWLTNNGPYHQELENALCEYLGVKYISLFSNGTLALITALQALRITGEVITTPFSFVATTHALYWNGITPVFADIEEENFNLDPLKIEAAITPKTTAILPVHVYGYPCRVDQIQKIADMHGLKIIYDAAHAFGVKLNSIPILNFGDLSILSFHATKVFNTFEGGAIVCHDEETKKRIDFLKNFGFADEVTVVAPGINAKMNELQAAFGILQLKLQKDSLEKRKILSRLYLNLIENINGVRILKISKDVEQNYGYFPVLINTKNYGHSRDEVYDYLKIHGVYARRYFYPLISQFPVYRGLPSSSAENLFVAERISREVLCLPMYSDMRMDQVQMICDLLLNLKSKR